MAVRKVAVVWKECPVEGHIEVRNGDLASINSSDGRNRTGKKLNIRSSGPARAEISIKNALVSTGPDRTVVTIRTQNGPFSFFLRDVNADTPICIPSYSVAVTDTNDPRSYNEIAACLEAKGMQTKLAAIDAEPEETFEEAAAVTRKLIGPAWLGLSRDMRIFEIGYKPEQGYWGFINPKFHGYPTTIPEVKDSPVWYGFVLGRGASCVVDLTRRLEDGVLPILHSRLTDDDVQYDMTSFVTLEKKKLTAANLRGTDFLVADGHAGGHMFTDEQQAEFDRRCKIELNQKEETVLCLRAEAINTARVPRYAWFKNIHHGPNGNAEYDPSTGFRSFVESGRIHCVSRINGQPLPQEEVAVLLQPGEKATFEFLLPHRPISKPRAAALAKKDFESLHADCREFWQKKLASGAGIDLPEPVVDEMVKAGLLHLDIVAYGREPGGSIAATIGVYAPIGSESSPIIQFFDSMGWHDVAERSIGYFLEKQHDDGFIQNFGGYMLETGPALWTMGEHYRYTRDDAWVKRIKDKLILACEFMLRWRQKEMKEKLRGRGYGMQAGKVADPEDPFHSFMLNGYAYAGMSRVSEMLKGADPKESRRWGREAKAFRTDIRETLANMMALSPVVPIGNGTWVPTLPPWAESTGPLALFAEPGSWWTHGAFGARDSLIGVLYLVLSEVLDPNEPAADFMLQWHSELMCMRNVGFSQPYYCRHDYIHARRGEVKPFLKTYYNGFTGLADRDTYSWWEHYFHASPHKTHEEGWFLMQTRWMLWQEEGSVLKLLPLIPRKWMTDGKEINLTRVASYFGPVTLNVQSHIASGDITASIECNTSRKPNIVKVRMPHPQGRKAISVKGGTYDPTTETVTVKGFNGKATIELGF